MTGVNLVSGPTALKRHHIPYSADISTKSIFPNAVILDDNQKLAKRAILAIRRGPIRYRRNTTIVCEGDPADYVFLLIDGTVRSCRTFRNGARAIVGFHIPGELFGWTDELKHPLSAEAATDAMILFFKRSTLLSIAAHESKIASFLLTAATSELRRVQEHSLLISRSAKCRVASFLLDLSVRTGKAKEIDLPMSHQDIADHLGLTIETVSRTITGMERSGLVERASSRTLILRDRTALARMIN
jgi:CRP/FNR family nitrogen fixation transcriptional regulator